MITGFATASLRETLKSFKLEVGCFKSLTNHKLITKESNNSQNQTSVLGEEADSLSVQQQRLLGPHGQFVFLHQDMHKMLTRNQTLQNKSRLTFGIILPTHCKMRLRGET